MRRTLLVVVLAACGSSPPPPPQPANSAPPTVAPAPPTAKIALGKDVFEKRGCVACHTVDGTARVGISMLHIWGKETKLVDGTTRIVDAAFIADAVVKPQQVRRDGYPPVMPTYEGQLQPDEIEALALYIESLK